MRKVYPNGTVALRSVSFDIQAGTVHGVVGANGAGKSTLVEILAGARTITSGDIVWRGAKTNWRTPAEATAAGVATIHQTIPLVPTLSTLENVFLWEKNPWRRSADDRSRLRLLLDRVGYQLDPDATVDSLAVGQRQMVAILQALATGAELIVMDEPTASLSRRERELIFATIKRLRDSGTSFIYVSHFLDEVLDLTDEITVLRDGRVVDSGATSDFDEARLTGAIAGRRLAVVEKATPRPVTDDREVLLEARGLSSPTGIADINLTLRSGEVLGLVGLAGSGRSELLHALFGADARARGTVEVRGRRSRNSIPARTRAGIALVPEERLRQGLVLEDELWRNISLPNLGSWSHFGIPDARAERARAEEAIEKLAIKTGSPDTRIAELSGGNAQKVLFAKWLLSGADVFLLDEPCHGIDVGAKADIVALIQDLAAAGQAAIVADLEFSELLHLCSRILVLRRGRIVAELRAEEVNEHELLMLASGLDQGGTANAAA